MTTIKKSEAKKTVKKETVKKETVKKETVKKEVVKAETKSCCVEVKAPKGRENVTVNINGQFYIFNQGKTQVKTEDIEFLPKGYKK